MKSWIGSVGLDSLMFGEVLEVHHAVLGMLLVIGFMVLMGFAILWNDVNKLRQSLERGEDQWQSQKPSAGGES